MQLTLKIESQLKMIRLGELLGRQLQPGNLLFLYGDLGAGKTTLTQGIARGLEIESQVTSPTFQLIKSYQGRWKLNHLDLYRLHQLSELDVLEPEELSEEGVMVVEWGELLLRRLQPEYLAITIVQQPGQLEREVSFNPFGALYEQMVKGINNADLGN